MKSKYNSFLHVIQILGDDSKHKSQLIWEQFLIKLVFKVILKYDVLPTNGVFIELNSLSVSSPAYKSICLT